MDDGNSWKRIMTQLSGDKDRLLRLLGVESGLSSESSEPQPVRADRTPDSDVLDAYSQAVVNVVESVGIAVLSIGPRDGKDGGSGSGFLITPDGYALTNSHVVHSRGRVAAITSDGDRLDAETVGDDPGTDLALIRVSARDLPYTQLGDSDALRVGQLVIAVGNPFGFQSTVSTGVVSAKGRAMRGPDGRLIEGMVQHTAPLNPGNSGGPLVDSRGRVIGINNSMIFMAQGLGFSIPSNTAKWVIAELIAHGRVRRAYLGVVVNSVPLQRRLVRELDLLNDHAVEVVSIDPDGPAAGAGIRAGDIIVALNDRLIAGIDDLHRIISKHSVAASEDLKASLVRDGERIELRVRLSQKSG